MRKLTMIALILCLFTSVPVFAGHHGKKQCCMSEHSRGACKYCGDKSCGKSHCPISAALMKKSCFFASNAEAIGLSDEQVKKIKAIGMEAKKQEILGQAQMKVAFIDMTAKLHEEKVDVEGLNKMVDEFSAGMADSTKKKIQAYAELKATLTPEQMAKAKEIWKKDKK